MFSLEKSNEFQEEYRNFKTQIDKIENQNAKDDCYKLLNSLLNEVRKIDIQHNEVVVSFRVPTATVETRKNITEIRKRILAKIQESI